MIYNPPSGLKLIEIIWEKVRGFLEQYNVTMVRAFPKSQLQGPVIAASLVSSIPGGKTREVYKPRFRGATVSADGNSIIEYYAQGFRHNYRFDVISSSASECDTITDAFENALHAIVPDLMAMGVQEFYPQDIRGTNVSEVSGEQLSYNTLNYVAISERVYRQAKPMITTVSLSLGVDVRRVVDYQMVRSTGKSDTIPYRSVYRVEFASLQPNLLETTVLQDMDELPVIPGVYIPGIDFVPYIDSKTGMCGLLWLDSGNSPSPGQTYYCTFSAYVDRIDSTEELQI